ncbi:hypothetical protein ACHAQH_007492 [Verticillium albo-atrum]
MTPRRDSDDLSPRSRPTVVNENTPLLLGPAASSATNHQAVPRSGRGRSDSGTEGSDEGDEIDPNEFDLLLARSVPTSGGFLEPESTVNPLLRGARRYSSVSRRRASATRSQSRPRTSIPRSFVDPVGNAIDSQDGPASPYLDREHGEQGLLLPTSDDEAKESPYLNGISTRRFWCIFSMILSTNFIACFDGTIMASSHPVITSYFNASNSASWLSTAFLLTSTSFQPLLGRISDSVGRKPPYVITMFIFALANVWCATATSMTSFIFARAACGLGAGGMMTLGSIIISDMVTIEARGEYQSYLNITYGIGSALGAALGGAMADHLGWRWEFGIQVFPLLVCVAVAFLTVPNHLGVVGKRETFLEALRAFDFRGSLLLTISITSLVLGLNLGGNVLPWSHPFVIAALITFSVAFPAFLYSQSLASRPIMPLYLVRHSPRANLIFANSLASILTNAILFNIPLYFQAVLLTSATASGLRLVIPSVVASTAGAITGLLITRTRRLKWPLAAGTTFFVLGTAALAALQRGWPSICYLLVLVPHSLGQGFQFPGTFMAVLAVSEQRDQAVVTSTLILWRSLGMVLGIATSSLVMQNALVVYLDRYVTGPGKADIIARVRESVETVAKLEGAAREQVVLSYEAALRLTFLCCVGVAFVSWCLIMPVKMPRLGQRK